jgi:hypothetical protein
MFVDSCDHYSTANITEKWPLSQSVAGNLTIQAGQGRRGTNAARSSANASFLGKLFPAAATWIVGMAARWQSAHPNTNPLMDWSDGTTIQAEVHITGVGQVQLRRGDGTVLATSSVGLGFNTYYYIEWFLTVSNTGGVSTIRVDGIPVVSVSSADTQMSANATANRLRLGNLGSIVQLGNLDMDDVYVCNGDGPRNTSFLGDCRVDYLPPNGDGTHRAWTPSAGMDHYALVDELAPNADTDYLGSSTTGAQETHTFPALPSMPNPVVKGVQHVANARKDDAGTRIIANMLLSGGTPAVGPTLHALALSYVCYAQLYETDPATGAPWTTTAVNALEAGVHNQ